jgi:ParB-like chromosome segregation protein Spo0J
MAVELAQEIDITLLQPHPRNVEIYGDEDVAELIELIKTSEWIKPLVVTQRNRIISGHSRWKAAQTLGYKTIPFERRSFATELEELEALLLENASRHKNTEQKLREARTWKYIETERSKLIQESQGAIGKELGSQSTISTLKQEANTTQENAKPLGSPGTQGVVPKTSNTSKKQRAPRADDRIAAKVEIGSRQTLKRGDKAIDAIDKLEEVGNKEAANGLRTILNGEKKNITAAAQLADLSEESVDVLAKIGTGQAKDVKTAKQIVRREKAEEEAKTVVLPKTMQVHPGDFRKIGHEKVADESVDLLFTDPPYHAEHIELWSELSEFAARVLKPGGVLLSYSGQIFLPDVLNRLSENLTYCWLLGIAHAGGHIQIWKHTLWNDWKPIVMFSKGPPMEHDWFMDLYRGDKGDKEAHEWSQGEGEAAYYIEKLTKPGQLVVDPMCGSGTILRAAHKLKRNSIGMEIDKSRHAVALSGMKELVS